MQFEHDRDEVKMLLFLSHFLYILTLNFYP
jgi:hypothetical protein